MMKDFKCTSTLSFIGIKYCSRYPEILPKATIRMNFPDIRPPLWSSGQSSWLQVQRPTFDSRHYQKKKVVGLERGPLSLVSTIGELFERKIAAPV
jgi:hypothetical protein